MKNTKINSDTKTLHMLLEQQNKKTKNLQILVNASKSKANEIKHNITVLITKQRELNSIGNGASKGGDIANIFKYCTMVSSSIDECKEDLSRVEEELAMRKGELNYSLKKEFSLTKLIERKNQEKITLETKMEQKSIDEFAAIKHAKKLKGE